MNQKRLGCFSPLAIASTLIALLVIVIVALTSGSAMFSPGELNARSGAPLGGVTSHAEIGNDCGKCHAPFWSAQGMSDLCLDCHVNIQAELQQPTSLHGVLFQGASYPCQSCHTEHGGAEASLTRMDRALFPHETTGFSLAAHQTRAGGEPFTCSDCHTQSIASFEPQTCADCHLALDQAYLAAHTQAFGLDCLACHDGVDRYSHFDHNQARFALTGLHQQAQCSACHAGAQTISALQSTPTDCASCHLKDDAHSGQFGTSCEACHTPEGWKPANFDHNLSGFPLVGKHAVAACESCHTAGYQGTPRDCFSCHQQDDAHNRQFGTSCEACHTPEGWLPANFDHNLSGFPLTGAHVQVQCTGCHANNVFQGTPTACAACHAEPAYHAGMFTGQACSACHTTSAWRPASYNGPHTFPMNHGGANSCADCHQPNLTQWTCYTCHNQTEVRSKHLGEGIQNFSDCLSCHPTGREEGGGGD